MQLEELKQLVYNFILCDHKTDYSVIFSSDGKPSSVDPLTKEFFRSDVETDPKLLHQESNVRQLVDRFPDLFQFYEISIPRVAASEAGASFTALKELPTHNILNAFAELPKPSNSLFIPAFELEQQLKMVLQQDNLPREQLSIIARAVQFPAVSVDLDSYPGYFYFCGLVAESDVFEHYPDFFEFYQLAKIFIAPERFYQKAWQDHRQLGAFYHLINLNLQSPYSLVASPTWYQRLRWLGALADANYPLAAYHFALLRLKFSYLHIDSVSLASIGADSSLGEAPKLEKTREQKRQELANLMRATVRRQPRSLPPSTSVLPAPRLVEKPIIYWHLALTYNCVEAQKGFLKYCEKLYPKCFGQQNVVAWFLFILNKLAKEKKLRPEIYAKKISDTLLKSYCYCLGSFKKFGTDEGRLNEDFSRAFSFFVEKTQGDVVTALALEQDVHLYETYLDYFFYQVLKESKLISKFIAILMAYAEKIESPDSMINRADLFRAHSEKCKRICFEGTVPELRCAPKKALPVPFYLYVALCNERKKMGDISAIFELADIFLTKLYSSTIHDEPVFYDAPSAMFYYRQVLLSPSFDRDLSLRRQAGARLYSIYQWYLWATTDMKWLDTLEAIFTDAQGTYSFPPLNLVNKGKFQFPLEGDDGLNWAAVAQYNWLIALFQLKIDTFRLGKNIINVREKLKDLAFNHGQDFIICLYNDVKKQVLSFEIKDVFCGEVMLRNDNTPKYRTAKFCYEELNKASLPEHLTLKIASVLQPKDVPQPIARSVSHYFEDGEDIFSQEPKDIPQPKVRSVSYYLEGATASEPE